MTESRCAKCRFLGYYAGRAICRYAGVKRELRWVKQCNQLTK